LYKKKYTENFKCNVKRDVEIQGCYIKRARKIMAKIRKLYEENPLQT
jgi:hypothetical protein